MENRVARIFERSISKQMRRIKSDNFKIITFENLFKQHVDSCCYVSARWRIVKFVMSCIVYLRTEQ